MDEIQWIFFDVGSTLMDESACYAQRFAQMAKEAGVSAEEMERLALAFAKKNKKGDHAAAKFYGISLPKWRSELERPYPEAKGVLKELTFRGFRLGIIANQVYGTKDRLKEGGLLKYFDLVLASAEEGVAKPDPEMFLRALQRADCPKERAMMVGDRLDNDIAPAKRIGMKTVWIRQGFGKYAVPQTETERADYTIDTLTDLLHIIER